MAGGVTFTTRFLEAVPRGPGTASFRFEKPEGFNYDAGQFFFLTIPGPDGPLKKPFTYSSSPTEPSLELTTRLSGSDFKNALEALVPGAEVEMRAPHGRFVLREGIARMACLIGGVGITPIRSMLRWLADNGARDPEVVVFYANRSESGITFGDELAELESRIPNMKTVNVLSNPGDGWEGRRGYISLDVVRAEIGDPAAWTYYLCGPPPMMDSMTKALAELGVPESQIVLERFGPPAKK